MNIEEEYLHLLKEILEKGVSKQTRNGTVKALFGRQIRHNFEEGFPLFTTKKMSLKNIFAELKWFLSGSTDIRDLWKYNCHIWDGDWYKSFINNSNTSYSLEEMQTKQNDPFFGKKTWELGPIYGNQWRKWNDIDIDQIQNLIDKLKNNPDDRGMLVSAWNVSDLEKMTLRPCHFSFQVYTRELTFKERRDLAQNYARKNNYLPLMIDAFGWTGTKGHMDRIDNTGWNIPKRAISLMWNQRSVDCPLGLPYNVASYALLLMMLAKQVNMIPEELIGSLGDCHIYDNQTDGVKELLKRSPFKLPTLEISDKKIEDISEYEFGDLELKNYLCYPPVKIPLSN